MDACELTKEEQHAHALNLRDYANQPGEHQTVKSADREPSVPTEPHNPATTSSSSSSRHRDQSLAAPIESQSTRTTNERAAESFSGEPELDSFDLDLKNKLLAYLAKETSDTDEDPPRENLQASLAKQVPDSEEDPPKKNLQTNLVKEIPDSDEDQPKKNLQPNLVKEIPDSEEDSVDDSDIERPKIHHEQLFHYKRNYKGHYKGRLPHEAPCFVAMDEVATQPATQNFIDPRRVGINASVNEKDKLDVLCILHPTTPKAWEAVKLVAKFTPQHILQNLNLSHMSKNSNDSIIESSTRSVTASPRGSMVDELALESKHQVAFERDGHQPMDIALRLSSKLHDQCAGFIFGRGQLKSDVIIAANDEDRISNRHFRIYLNESTMLMLEDTSINGTLVDDTFLRANTRQDPTAGKRRMIANGTRISLLLNKDDKNLQDTIRFIVTIPARDGAEDRYQNKLEMHVNFLKQAERQRAVRAEGSQKGAATAILLPTNPLAANALQKPMFNDPSQSLMAGTKHGMEWNGGETYNVIGVLGQGAFATVYRIATKSDGDLRAAKVIEKRRFVKNGILDHKIKNEMHIMKDLEHPHIIKFFHHEETRRNLVLIMELVPSGDLSACLATGRAVPEFKCQRIAWQICSALEYLHSRNITHRDIKPENILIESEEPLNVKLSDFGLSKQITNNDAYLQTFCGTILYCAPEIYPGYDQYKSGKAGKRRRLPTDPPLKTLPYQQSVDIWALAAVLYHLLCAHPPYEGTGENHGQVMLDNVMNNDVDFSELRSAGVSGDGVDFVAGMLKHDPTQRATEVQCLQHAWIAQMAGSKANDQEMQGTTTLGAIEEDQDEFEPSQLSQLSLSGNPRGKGIEIVDSDMEYETDIDELADTRQSKRFKPNIEAHRGKQQEQEISSDVGHVHGGSTRNYPAGTNRLFGEIGASALRSSGTLSYDARAALEIPYQNRDKSADSRARKEQKEQTVSSDELAQQHPLQYPQLTQTYSRQFFTPSSPSLLGAEVMVGQLNMASHKLPVSAPSPDSIATMPPTGLLSQSTIASSKHANQVLPSTDEHTTKRARVNHPDASSEPSQPGQSSANYSSCGTQTTKTHDEGLPEPSAPATAAEDTSNGSGPGKGKERSKDDSADANEPANAESSLASTVPKAAGEAAFAAPKPRLGLLTTMPGSVCNTTIKLEERFTHFGRDPASHAVYEDNMDTRVPKNALDIIWWKPGLEALEEGGADWKNVDGLYALAHTRTSIHIRVNGVKLTKGKDCWNYGRLHTGDVITIFGPEDGRAGDFLKFRCEFFWGASAKPREAPFLIEKEYEKFRESQAKRARLSLANQESQGSNGAQGSETGTQGTASPAMSGADLQGPGAGGPEIGNLGEV